MEQVDGKNIQVTCCGLCCGACASHNGQVQNTAKYLNDLLTVYDFGEWVPLLAEVVPATKHYSEFAGLLDWFSSFSCPGCEKGGGDPDCPIRLCAKEKGIAGCWECDKAPCEKIQHIDQGYAPIPVNNRQRIQEIGVEKWREEQAAKIKAGYNYFDAVGQRILQEKANKDS